MIASPVAASRFASLAGRLAELLESAIRISAKKPASARRFEGARRHCGVPISERSASAHFSFFFIFFEKLYIRDLYSFSFAPLVLTSFLSL